MTEAKLGLCPYRAAPTNAVSSDCLDDCDGHDYKCSNTQKCCWNRCNRICENAEELGNVSMEILPSIPVHLTVVSVEHEFKRKAQLSWEMFVLNERLDAIVDYAIEARVHIGHTFARHKLSDWFVFNADDGYRTELRITSENLLR